MRLTHLVCGFFNTLNKAIKLLTKFRINNFKLLKSGILWTTGMQQSTYVNTHEKCHEQILHFWSYHSHNLNNTPEGCMQSNKIHQWEVLPGVNIMKLLGRFFLLPLSYGSHSNGRGLHKTINIMYFFPGLRHLPWRRACCSAQSHVQNHHDQPRFYCYFLHQLKTFRCSLPLNQTDSSSMHIHISWDCRYLVVELFLLNHCN